MERSEIINWLIKKFDYKNYLEIGIAFPEACYERIEAEQKIGVDPNPSRSTPGLQRTTSDDFFKQNRTKFDIVFIDGLHKDYQVLRDFYNARWFLNPGGTIMLHDCLPAIPEHIWESPDWSRCGAWFGTVWRAWAHLRMFHEDLEMFVIDTDCGCGIIREGTQSLFPYAPPCNLNWDYFQENKDQLMLPKLVQEWQDFEMKRLSS